MARKVKQTSKVATNDIESQKESVNPVQNAATQQEISTSAPSVKASTTAAQTLAGPVVDATAPSELPKKRNVLKKPSASASRNLPQSSHNDSQPPTMPESTPFISNDPHQSSKGKASDESTASGGLSLADWEAIVAETGSLSRYPALHVVNGPECATHAHAHRKRLPEPDPGRNTGRPSTRSVSDKGAMRNPSRTPRDESGDSDEETFVDPDGTNVAGGPSENTEHPQGRPPYPSHPSFSSSRTHSRSFSDPYSTNPPFPAPPVQADQQLHDRGRSSRRSSGNNTPSSSRSRDSREHHHHRHGHDRSRDARPQSQWKDYGSYSPVPFETPSPETVRALATHYTARGHVQTEPLSEAAAIKEDYHRTHPSPPGSHRSRSRVRSSGPGKPGFMDTAHEQSSGSMGREDAPGSLGAAYGGSLGPEGTIPSNASSTKADSHHRSKGRGNSYYDDPYSLEHIPGIEDGSDHEHNGPGGGRGPSTTLAIMPPPIATSKTSHRSRRSIGSHPADDNHETQSPYHASPSTPSLYGPPGAAKAVPSHHVSKDFIRRHPESTGFYQYAGWTPPPSRTSHEASYPPHPAYTWSHGGASYPGGQMPGAGYAGSRNSIYAPPVSTHGSRSSRHREDLELELAKARRRDSEKAKRMSSASTAVGMDDSGDEYGGTGKTKGLSGAGEMSDGRTREKRREEKHARRDERRDRSRKRHHGDHDYDSDRGGRSKSHHRRRSPERRASAEYHDATGHHFVGQPMHRLDADAQIYANAPKYGDKYGLDGNKVSSKHRRESREYHDATGHHFPDRPLHRHEVDAPVYAKQEKHRSHRHHRHRRSPSRDPDESDDDSDSSFYEKTRSRSKHRPAARKMRDTSPPSYYPSSKKHTQRQYRSSSSHSRSPSPSPSPSRSRRHRHARPQSQSQIYDQSR